MNSSRTSPRTLLRSFYVNRRLVMELTKRDIAGRYQGSVLGAFWSLINPLILLGMYSFVFGVIFKSRWNNDPSSGLLGFSILIFAGMLIHGLFSEVSQRATELIVGNANYVKKVIFPLEILPWMTVLTGLFHMAMASIVLLAGIFLMEQRLPVTIFLAPLVILAYIPFVAGVGWILASIGVFFRDLKQLVGVLTALMQFLAPVFYPLSSVPPKLRVLIEANPLTLIITQLRTVAIDGQLPDWIGLTRYFVFSCLFALVSLWWFKRTSKAFADVV